MANTRRAATGTTTLSMPAAVFRLNTIVAVERVLPTKSWHNCRYIYVCIGEDPRLPPSLSPGPSDITFPTMWGVKTILARKTSTRRRSIVQLIPAVKSTSNSSRNSCPPPRLAAAKLPPPLPPMARRTTWYIILVRSFCAINLPGYALVLYCLWGHHNLDQHGSINTQPTCVSLLN